jgi:capsular exopolysaccharide synthesis family protein
MSRVEEALRRAGAGSLVDHPGSQRGLDRASAGSDMASAPLAVEDYPCEVPATRTEKPVAPSRELPRAVIAAPRAGSSRTLGRLGEEVEGKIVGDTETSPVSIEQYRRLAATLHQMQVEGGLKTIMISSALPRDGKTLTSTNLALTLSESYQRRVLLIDADLRKPSLHALFRLPNARGLADGLCSEAPALPLIEVTSRLTVLPAGTADHSPMAGLTSDRMGAILKEAAGRFDWVLIDTPPIGLISDANLLARHVDGVLLVIGAGSTDYAAVKRTVNELGRERIIGVVLNRVHEEHTPNAFYQNYYAGHGDEASTGS